MSQNMPGAEAEASAAPRVRSQMPGVKEQKLEVTVEGVSQMKEVVVSKPLSEETAGQTDLGAAALLSGPHGAQTSQEASGRELERNVQGGAVVEELVQATGDNDKSHLIRLLADD